MTTAGPPTSSTGRGGGVCSLMEHSFPLRAGSHLYISLLDSVDGYLTLGLIDNDALRRKGKRKKRIKEMVGNNPVC